MASSTDRRAVDLVPTEYDPAPAPRRRPSTYARALRMMIRGLGLRLLLSHSRGPVFRGRRVTVSGARQIRSNGRLVLEDFVDLQGTSQRGVSFGAGVSIGRGTEIRPSSYYGGEPGLGLQMGDRSSINSGGFIGCSGWIEIGRDVIMGPGVRIFSENHNFDQPDVPIKDQGVTRGTVVIEDDCWIASGVTILPNVRIGRGSVVAAGSVVNKDLPPYSVAAGTPAKVIRTRTEL